MFAEVFNEATNTCFRLIYEGLRRNIFSPENPAGHVQARTPPLASLLPQLKASAAKLVPSDSSLCHEVREIAAGPALDTLCIYLFNSPEMAPTTPTSTPASSSSSNFNGTSASATTASSAAASNNSRAQVSTNRHNGNFSGGPLL
jgi:hypothetical protein